MTIQRYDAPAPCPCAGEKPRWTAGENGPKAEPCTCEQGEPATDRVAAAREAVQRRHGTFDTRTGDYNRARAEMEQRHRDAWKFRR